MSAFQLLYTPEAKSQLNELEKNPALSNECKVVKRALGLMATNLKHPSLQTHEYQSLRTADGGKVFEAYGQQRTPGAYRIFWCYGPNRGQITVITIIPHP